MLLPQTQLFDSAPAPELHCLEKRKAREVGSFEFREGGIVGLRKELVCLGRRASILVFAGHSFSQVTVTDTVVNSILYDEA